MANDALSALFDGELSGPEMDRLLDEIERSPELGRQWSRLCASREAQAGTRIAEGQRCICSGVMAALDAEPARAYDKVVDLAVRRAGRPSLSALWKPALGLAAAASVGAAAVLLVQPQVAGVSPGGQVAAAPTTRMNVIPAEYRPADEFAEADNDTSMARYLMDHNNAISDEGVGGTLRYARFAAYKAEYRSQPETYQ